MALTESTMLPLGTKAPEFNLPDTVSGKTLNSNDLKGEKATVIMFICNHCPFVIHVNDELVRLSNDYTAKGVSFIGISSNNVATHPQDGPERMTEHAKSTGYNFPYLYDESQEVARAYDAACTPDLYVFDAEMNLAYRGRIDASRPGNDKPVTGEDMRKAIDLIISGKAVPEPHYPSAGCNIKWK